MRKLDRRALIPALAAVSLTLTACSSSGMHRPAAAGDVPREKPPLVGSSEWELGTGPTGPARPGAVPGPARGDRATARPEPEADPGLKVASFDARTGRAVITVAPPAAGPSASPSPARTREVRTGDVIASPPVNGAPGGVLAQVVEVLRRTARGTEVRTTPATLDTVLGGARAAVETAVDPSDVEVGPLLPGVTVSRTTLGGDRVGPRAAGLPPGSLRVDVNTALPTGKDAAGPAGATVSGSLRLAPRVGFSYDGRAPGGGPKAASLTLSGDWSAQWKLKGQTAAAHGKPLRVPFARLHADPVLSVGGIPVVVNVDVTYAVLIDADGKAAVDVEQSTQKSEFRIGGSYRAEQGWVPEVTADSGTPSVKAAIDGAAAVRTGLGTEMSVGLYGNPAVTGDLTAPYVRTEAQGRAGAADGTGWKLFGGTDLRGSLLPRLKVFGTPAPATDAPALPRARSERQLARGDGTVRVPPPRDDRKPPPSGRADPQDGVPGRSRLR